MNYLVTSQIIVENDVDEFNGKMVSYPDYKSFKEETAFSQKTTLTTDRLKENDKNEIIDLKSYNASHINVDFI